MGVRNHDPCGAESQRQAQEQEGCRVGRAGEASLSVGLEALMSAKYKRTHTVIQMCFCLVSPKLKLGVEVRGALIKS